MYFSLSNKDIKDLNLLSKVGGIQSNVFPYAFLLFSLFTTHVFVNSKNNGTIFPITIFPKFPFSIKIRNTTNFLIFLCY